MEYLNTNRYIKSKIKNSNRSISNQFISLVMHSIGIKKKLQNLESYFFV